jgi:hypothetical protein
MLNGEKRCRYPCGCAGLLFLFDLLIFFPAHTTHVCREGFNGMQGKSFAERLLGEHKLYPCESAYGATDWLSHIGTQAASPCHLGSAGQMTVATATMTDTARGRGRDVQPAYLRAASLASILAARFVSSSSLPMGDARRAALRRAQPHAWGTTPCGLIRALFYAVGSRALSNGTR